jgi:hypothetical protein
MELYLKGTLQNVFRNKDFKDKTTGQIASKGKYQLQFMEEIEGAEGVQLVIHKVSIPDILAIKYMEKRGQEVEIKVKPLVNGGKVSFYGVA